MDFEKKSTDKKPDFNIGTDFGLKLDQYSKKTGALKNKSAASQAREWTEQETLLLLEALEVSSIDIMIISLLERGIPVPSEVKEIYFSYVLYCHV